MESNLGDTTFNMVTFLILREKCVQHFKDNIFKKKKKTEKRERSRPGCLGNYLLFSVNTQEQIPLLLIF